MTLGYRRQRTHVIGRKSPCPVFEFEDAQQALCLICGDRLHDYMTSHIYRHAVCIQCGTLYYFWRDANPYRHRWRK